MQNPFFVSYFPWHFQMDLLTAGTFYTARGRSCSEGLKPAVIGHTSGFLGQAGTEFWNKNMHVLPWALQSRGSATFHNSNFQLKQERFKSPTPMFPKPSVWQHPVQDNMLAHVHRDMICTVQDLPKFLENSRSKIIMVNWEIIVLNGKKTKLRWEKEKVSQNRHTKFSYLFEFVSGLFLWFI